LGSRWQAWTACHLVHRRLSEVRVIPDTPGAEVGEVIVVRRVMDDDELR
jgi:hypothetical protein